MTYAQRFGDRLARAKQSRAEQCRLATHERSSRHDRAGAYPKDARFDDRIGWQSDSDKRAGGTKILFAEGTVSRGE